MSKEVRCQLFREEFRDNNEVKEIQKNDRFPGIHIRLFDKFDVTMKSTNEINDDIRFDIRK